MRTGGPVPAVLGLCLWLCLWLWPCRCRADGPAERQALVLPRRLGAAGGGRERFRLEAFGERLTLELEPDSSFLAPDFTLQYLGGPPPPQQPPPPPEEDDLSRCFYSGTVNRDPSSAAALSLCAGMRGAFSLRGRQYLIQPAPGTAHRRGPHLLRLRGTRRAAPAARCAVAEAEAGREEEEEAAAGTEPAGHAGTVGAPGRPPRERGRKGEGGSASPCDPAPDGASPSSPPRGAAGWCSHTAAGIAPAAV